MANQQVTHMHRSSSQVEPSHGAALSSCVGVQKQVLWGAEGGSGARAPWVWWCGRGNKQLSGMRSVSRFNPAVVALAMLALMLAAFPPHCTRARRKNTAVVPGQARLKVVNYTAGPQKITL
jgi:hypothetical protein